MQRMRTPAVPSVLQTCLPRWLRLRCLHVLLAAGPSAAAGAGQPWLRSRRDAGGGRCLLRKANSDDSVAPPLELYPVTDGCAAVPHPHLELCALQGRKGQSVQARKHDSRGWCSMVHCLSQ